MKNIIQRNLPLNQRYTLVDKTYIPLLVGNGCTCANCNKLLANIAIVKNEKGGTLNIGFDCLETLLLNNGLLNGDIAHYEKSKKMISKIIRFSKKIKTTIKENPSITGISFETPKYESDWFTFYWLCNNETFSRNNDNIKIKEMEFEFLLKILKNIFSDLDIFIH